MTENAEQQPYKRPPITEAVIGVQFANYVAGDELHKVSARFKREYPGEQPVKNFGIRVTNLPDGRPPITDVQETSNFRRMSVDATEIILFTPDQFIVSQLPPYVGWDVFFSRFQRDWKIWKREMSYRRIQRLGVRYINRIDVPNTAPYIDQEKYLNVYVQLPKELGPTSRYATQAVLPMRDIDSQAVINTSVVPSPLLNYTSFLIDIDVAKLTDPPQRDQEILELLTKIRDKKNMIFEACITNHARELFSQ